MGIWKNCEGTTRRDCLKLGLGGFFGTSLVNALRHQGLSVDSVRKIAPTAKKGARSAESRFPGLSKERRNPIDSFKLLPPTHPPSHTVTRPPSHHATQPHSDTAT